MTWGEDITGPDAEKLGKEHPSVLLHNRLAHRVEAVLHQAEGRRSPRSASPST